MIAVLSFTQQKVIWSNPYQENSTIILSVEEEFWVSKIHNKHLCGLYGLPSSFYYE